jgi:hypothetical protein
LTTVNEAFRANASKQWRAGVAAQKTRETEMTTIEDARVEGAIREVESRIFDDRKRSEARCCNQGELELG